MGLLTLIRKLSGWDLETRTEDFRNAVKENKPDLARTCLNVGVEDDAVKWAFWKAATFKSPAMMKVILEKGTDINARDKDGNTALILAAKESPYVVFALLKKGADPNIANGEGKTALMAAAWFEIEAVRYLVRFGADIHARDNEGKTVLMSACGTANRVVIKELLKLGVDINATDKEGRTAISLAFEKGQSGHGLVDEHQKVAAFLLDKGANIDPQMADTIRAWEMRREHLSRTEWERRQRKEQERKLQEQERRLRVEQGLTGLSRCQRCAGKAFSTEDFYAECESAGFSIDRPTGRVKLRTGVFSVVGSVRVM